jgi:DNA polymerase-3 subunit epsilon
MASEKNRFRYLVGASIFFCALLFLCGYLLLIPRTGDAAARSQVDFFLAGALCAAVFMLVLFIAIHILLIRPLEVLRREIRIITQVNPCHVIELSSRHLLGDLQDAINDLGLAFMKARRETAEAVSASSGELENKKVSLETILMSLREGIMVCDKHARIMFYNPAAGCIFHDNSALGLGRSLYLLCSPAPIENSREILRRRRLRGPEGPNEDNDVSFVCSTLQGIVLSCRLCLFPEIAGLSWSFLFTCEDISRETDIQVRREDLLRRAVGKMRDPLTSLVLNIEGLEQFPNLDAAARCAMTEDIGVLVEQFETLAHEIQDMGSPQYVVRNIFAEDAAACVAGRLWEKGVTLTMIGDPLWVRADINALLLLLEFFALKLHDHFAVNALEMETLLGDKRVYFDYYWAGPPVPPAVLAAWTACLPETSNHTVAEMLKYLGSDVWSIPHKTPGFAVLRFPMPSTTGQSARTSALLPARPVYTDFAACEPDEEIARIKDLPLDRLSFVVFDSETTGLSPLEGDRIVSLAGVKIINKGIIVGETFDRLVDPGRDIPVSSTRFHGITDEMVKGMPMIEDILKAFHAYVGDSVLVGHNAAFDMRFIRMNEDRAGVRFRRPVLDTLALSHYLHDHTPEHSLDAVAKRLGVEVRGRHTAIGDSLITAQIFIKFLYLLQKRGISKLGDALKLSRL